MFLALIKGCNNLKVNYLSKNINKLRFDIINLFNKREIMMKNEWDLINKTLPYLHRGGPTQYYKITYRKTYDKMYFTGVIDYRGEKFVVEAEEFKNALNELLLEDVMLREQDDQKILAVMMPLNIPGWELGFFLK